jgi:alkylation response protein AidB-like acyl-CoA dehydrogenase
MIKYSATDMCGKVDECLQLFGGYGYMWDYPISRMLTIVLPEFMLELMKL